MPGLEFINKLKPVTYHFDVRGLRHFLGEDVNGEGGREGASDGKTEMSAEAQALVEAGVKQKEQIVYTGFIAQDVERAAQEVNYDFSGVDKPQNEHSLYGLRYAEFVVPLVKAVQELDDENNGLRSEVEILKSEIENLKYLITSYPSMKGGEVNLSRSDQEAAFLGQNVPNPFNNSTSISFRIPDDCNDASIVITESATGRVVRAIPVSCHETQVTLEMGAVAGGSYSYSLHVDGQVIDTRTMIITL